MDAHDALHVTSSRWRNVAKAGAVYFAVVFVVAFAIGVVRTLLIAPRIGDVRAVLLEAPIIIGVSWIVSPWVVGKFSVRAGQRDRLAMGLVAFSLLMTAEMGFSVLAFGQTLASYLASFFRPAGIIGLAAQMIFALVPWVQGILDARQAPE